MKIQIKHELVDISLNLTREQAALFELSARCKGVTVEEWLVVAGEVYAIASGNRFTEIDKLNDKINDLSESVKYLESLLELPIARQKKLDKKN